MADTFTILDDGETLITGEWRGLEEAQQRMLALADSYDNMMPALLASREAAIESTSLHFETESDPQGNPWVPLDPDYLKYKVQAGYPSDEILVRTGEGKKAALSEEAWFISEDALWFNEQALPSYMKLHQDGTSQSSDASNAVLGKLRRGESITMEEAGIAVAEGGGRGLNLPKREFVGFDETDTAVFESIWNTWFSEQLIQEFPTGGGASTSETGFNMMGEFPVIGRTGRGQPILRTPFGPRFGRM